MFFYQKTSNFHNSGIIGCRMLSDPSVNNILMFCRLVYNIHLFKWPDIGLKWIITITPNGQSLKFKTNVWNISISETGRNCDLLFKLVDDNWVVIMEQKRKIEFSWACTFQASQGFNRFQGFLGWKKIIF